MEIQGKAIKRSKRNAVSRLLHAKYDKGMISTWKLDLTRILRVFNVRSIVSIRLLLIVHMQIELATNTHEIISDVHHDIVNTHAMGSGMHRNMLQIQEGTYQYQPVSDIHIL